MSFHNPFATTTSTTFNLASDPYLNEPILWWGTNDTLDNMESAWTSVNKRMERAPSLEIQTRAASEVQTPRSIGTFPIIDQQLNTRRAYSLCHSSHTNALKRPYGTASANPRKRSKTVPLSSTDELQAITDAAAEGEISNAEAECQFTALETSMSGCEDLVDGEGTKETRCQNFDIQRGSQPTEESLREVSGTKPAAIANIEGGCAAEAPRNLEPSPVESISPVEAVSPMEVIPPVKAITPVEVVPPMEAAEIHTNAGLNEDMQSSQNCATFQDSEGTKVATPQTETEPISRELGSSLSPIIISDDFILGNNRELPILIDDDSEDDMGIEDGGKTDELITFGSKSDTRRSQPPSRLPGIIDWTLGMHKEEREEMLRIEWVNVQELWAQVYTCEAYYRFRRLRAFEKKMIKAWERVSEHDNLSPGKARKLCSRWKEIEGRLLRKVQAQPDKEILCEFGQALVRLQEMDAERQSGAISMSDGDKNDNDYVPGR